MERQNLPNEKPEISLSAGGVKSRMVEFLGEGVSPEGRGHPGVGSRKPER
jgi:hypothetical protein